MTIYDLLIWLTGSGAVIAVSWLCERWSWFQAQGSEIKKWIMYGASAVIAIAALLIQQYVPVETLELVAPYVTVLISIFGMIFLNQAGHVLDPARTRGK